MNRRRNIRRPARKRFSRRAFTLIELILVMVILTVAVGLAAPRLSAFFRGRALDSEARRLLSLTRYAQDRASSEGVPVRMWFDTQTGWYGVRTDQSFEQDDKSELRFQVGDGVRIQVTAHHANDSRSDPLARRMSARSAEISRQASRDNLEGIRFLPEGIPDPTAKASISLTDADDYTLTVAPAPNLLTYEVSKGRNW